ncbi:hypothetical protein HPG69_004142 [Diceros bicornis minor]|uniref:Uncharacterized protein n=1 Tax=Diceros bicornis minor TaxID=77932 RepID=A0A7J7E9H9_DICBM|nr:hypothetical protein HPG69_004142 [Diceros bicornis minor]
MLDNDTREYGNSVIHMKNKCFSKDPLNSEKYGEAYKNKWSHCGEKCYYFSDRDKNLEENHWVILKRGRQPLDVERWLLDEL